MRRVRIYGARWLRFGVLWLWGRMMLLTVYVLSYLHGDIVANET